MSLDEETQIIIELLPPIINMYSHKDGETVTINGQLYKKVYVDSRTIVLKSVDILKDIES